MHNNWFCIAPTLYSSRNIGKDEWQKQTPKMVYGLHRHTYNIWNIYTWNEFLIAVLQALLGRFFRNGSCKMEGFSPTNRHHSIWNVKKLRLQIQWLNSATCNLLTSHFSTQALFLGRDNRSPFMKNWASINSMIESLSQAPNQFMYT